MNMPGFVKALRTLLTKALLMIACVGTVLFSWAGCLLGLAFANSFFSLGVEGSILVRILSALNIVCPVLIVGVPTGMVISEKKIQVRRVMAYLLFLAGFLIAPLVGVSILVILDALLIDGINGGLIFGGSVVTYLLLYMGLWFRLKKRGGIKLGFPFKFMNDDVSKQQV